MNFARAYNYIIGTVLIVIYLALPATNFAYATNQEGGVPSAQAVCSVMAAAPCDDCPCSDGHGSDCCDSTFCSCACHAPLGQGIQLVYAPVIDTQSFREPTWSLPQVYRPIFVPPQNLA
jgi:hypothetical protein